MLVVSMTVFVCIPTVALLTISGGEKDAYIAHVGYNSRIRVQTDENWNFTVFNRKLNDSQFFFMFYLDDKLWLDEYNSTSYSTWRCEKGRSASRCYGLPRWNSLEPLRQNIRVDLYASHNGTFILEDEVSFSIAVTVLMPLQHIYATSYFALYLIAGFVSLTVYYITRLGLED